MTANLKGNIIANYAGSIWSALMGVVFVPLYIRFMGIESYGLVGFFATLVSLFSILDMGLNITLNREMARRSVLQGQEQATRDLLRTLEIIYWSVAILIGGTVALLSYPIARYWLNTQHLSISDVQRAVMIMGFVVIMRWPFGLYQGGLMGLQQQVLVNILNTVSGTLRGLGAVLVLWLVAPTIQAFFCWQIIVSGLETLTMAYFLWCALPPTRKRPEFRWAVLVDIWRFATQMMGVNVLVMILSQSDKILLSKMLTLEMYGYYMLAWTVAMSLFRLAGPVFSATFPRFTQLVASHDTSGLSVLYHKSCQFMSVMVLPLASVLALFSYEILLVWIGKPDIAQQTHLVLSILIVGTTGNTMTSLPWGLQLASNWMTLTIWSLIISIVILIPLMIWTVYHYGMIGGAIAWALLHIGHVLVYVQIMHLKILRGHYRRWFVNDVALPSIAAITPVLVARFAFNGQLTGIWFILFLGSILCLSYLGAALASSGIRYYLGLLIARSVTWLKSNRISNSI